MTKKDREAWYVEQLRSLWASFPAGPRSASENPDCLVQSADGVVGVEVTEFTLSPDDGRQPTRERISLRRQIVDRARESYRARGGPVLIVDIEFDDHLRLSKADVDARSDEIANRLLSHNFTEDDAIGWYQEVPLPLPRGVLSISGGRYRSAESWDGGSGALVRDCTVADLQEVIEKKANRYDTYRSQCRAVILLIVFSYEHDPHTELPAALFDHVYRSPFDRTVALLFDIPQAIPLKTVAPVA